MTQKTQRQTKCDGPLGLACGHRPCLDTTKEAVSSYFSIFTAHPNLKIDQNRAKN
ncbi:MAG: hypothetical protein DSM107014_03320 [Gomphosphaeria aponina SAG 52.96 = DSM 107014]|uniref:Uncharacterized protein n=1 Tax=Gomphosphaeria aponina SAG 52.96 = DSM 107014 TaxID=1521640 RepID=A0A941GWX8_9CHRO|nr:hypothetical protein [Gomphosphaeria aponina SAG 52.96 = DSM 107014]